MSFDKDFHALNEKYSKQLITELGLGQAAVGSGLEAPIKTVVALHKPSDYQITKKKCHCKHNIPCHQCNECNNVAEECEGCIPPAVEAEEKISHTQLCSKIENSSSLLHQICDILENRNEKYKVEPWLAEKISAIEKGINELYDRLDYELTTSNKSEENEDSIESGYRPVRPG